MISSLKEEREGMSGAIRYIKFSGDYDKFDQCKEKTKAIDRHKGILKYLTKEVDIPIEDEAENDEERMKIYEEKIQGMGFPNHVIYRNFFWSGQIV